MTDSSASGPSGPHIQPEPPQGQPVHRPHGPYHTRKVQPDNFRTILSTVAILLLAPVIALTLTAFVFQSYQVDGQSMETTLQDKNRLIVWKVSRTWARITRHAYIPDRGDIVIFTDDALSMYGEDPSKQLIKRVIGLPGERVVVKDNVVTVYNREHPEGIHPDTSMPYGNIPTLAETPGDVDTTVGSDQIFVMGDNRKNSLDSRMLGPVDADHIIGKLVVRILPLNEIKRF